MEKINRNISVRWFYMTIGVIAMLFAGVIYAWSILKAPLATELGWGQSELALNFTLAMTFFCIGGLLGARISGHYGHKIALVSAGILSSIGFILTSFLSSGSVITLYITYGVVAGLGIGITYNVIISTVGMWFPDKKGLCSGCLMMGFGASALILGNLIDIMFKSSIGWRNTYIILGVALFCVLILSGILIKKPDSSVILPEAETSKNKEKENFEKKDFTSAQMLCRPSFWMAFICISFLSAVGSSVISFAKDLAIFVGSPEKLAVSLVGVLSVCNGIGRILTGAVFDIIGRRKTMICSNSLAICTSAITLLAVSSNSLVLCVAGLCLTGVAYGSCATITAAFTSSFFGTKHFSNNMAIMTFTVMVGSFVATAANKLLEITGGYSAAFTMLLSLTVVALVLNFLIREPK